MTLTNIDSKTAITYKIREITLASIRVISPRGMGRYGFDILSALMSTT